MLLVNNIKSKATASVGNACRGSGEDGTLFVLGLIICVIMDVDLWDHQLRR